MNNRILFMLSFLLICCCGACVTERVEEPDSGEAFLKREVETIVQKIPYQSNDNFFVYLNKLIAYGPYAIEPMRECLNNSNAKVRLAGAYVLGQLQAEDALEDLLDLTEDKSKIVRLEAARAVMEIGVWDTIPVLLDGMGDENETIRILSFQVLTQKTGEDFGYKFSGTMKERGEAIDRWRQWWENIKRDESMAGHLSSG